MQTPMNTSKGNMAVYTIVGLLIIAGAVWFFTVRNSGKNIQPASMNESPMQAKSVPSPETIAPIPVPNQPTTPPPVSSQLREFNVRATQFTFDPPTITVKKGDTVKINLTSVDVSHGFAIQEFGLNIMADAGETKSGTFIADTVGTFRSFCSVFCGGGHKQMEGTLVVTE